MSSDKSNADPGRVHADVRLAAPSEERGAELAELEAAMKEIEAKRVTVNSKYDYDDKTRLVFDTYNLALTQAAEIVWGHICNLRQP